MHKYVVVDDEELIRKGIIKEIESFNQQLQCVGEAENGEDALRLIKEKNPEIILTDMRMPALDGKFLLKMIQQEFPDKKVIVISGYTDFEYMQEAISASVVGYLLKPYSDEEVFKALSKAVSLIEKDSSIRNGMEKVHTVELEKERLDYAKDIQSLTDLILTPMNIKTSLMVSNHLQKLNTSSRFVLSSLFCSDTSILDEAKKSGLIPHIGNAHLAFHNPANSQMLFILFYFGTSDSKSIQLRVTTEIRRLSSELNLQSESGIKVGVSREFDNIASLHSAYNDTISCLNQVNIKSGNEILTYPASISKAADIHWKKYPQLVYFMESGNTNKALEMLSDFFTLFDRYNSLSLIDVKNNCQILYNIIRDVLKNHFDIVTGSSVSSSYEAVIGMCFDMKSIQLYFSQLVTNITLMLKDKNIYPSNQLAENIRAYIEKNYQNDLNLGQISSMFHISPSYCSLLFKEETGETFTDYLNRVRIHKGKELLRSSEYPVYKIAKLLGYDNTKYFFRIFKKVTGQTPIEFKKQFS